MPYKRFTHKPDDQRKQTKCVRVPTLEKTQK